MSKPVGVDNTARRKFDIDQYNELAIQQHTDTDIQQAEAKRRRLAGTTITQSLQRHQTNTIENKLKSSIGTQRVHSSTDAGIKCDVCDIVLKDSKSYINHLNSAKHLKMLGQSTQILRSNYIDCKLRLLQYAQLNNSIDCMNVPGLYKPVQYIDWSDVLDVKSDLHTSHDNDTVKLETTTDANDSIQLPMHSQNMQSDSDRDAPPGLHVSDDDNEQSEMQRLMGFGGFGTTNQNR